MRVIVLFFCTHTLVILVCTNSVDESLSEKKVLCAKAAHDCRLLFLLSKKKAHHLKAVVQYINKCTFHVDCMF